MFHIHKFGKVEADNFQYCSVCGKASPAPDPCKNGHKYKEHNKAHITNVYNVTQEVINLQCERCGHFTQYNATTGQYETR